MKTFAQKSAYDSPWSVKQRAGMLFWEFCWKLFCSWTPKPLNRWRLLWLRIFGACMQGTPFVHQRARIQIPWNLTMRDRSCLGDRANAYSLGKIEIGEGATVSQEAYLCTGTHDFLNPAFPLRVGRIRIEPYAFIGARAFILPSITVGDHAIVGACSVVTRDVKAGSRVAGNPAVEIGPT